MHFAQSITHFQHAISHFQNLWLVPNWSFFLFLFQVFSFFHRSNWRRVSNVRRSPRSLFFVHIDAFSFVCGGIARSPASVT